MNRRRLWTIAAATAALAGLLLAEGAEPTRPKVERYNSGGALARGLPFSEAVRVGDLVFLSGRVGVVPGTTDLVPGGIGPEARQALINIRTTLTTIGLGMNDLVKCTVMLADIGEWAAFNEVYREFFAGSYPARSAFGVSGLAIGARVEIECIAAMRDDAGAWAGM